MRICNQCGVSKDVDEYHLKETTCKMCRHERRSELRRMKRFGVQKDVSWKGEECYKKYKKKMDRVKKKYDEMREDMQQLEEKNDELVETVQEMKSKERRKKERVKKIVDDVDAVTQGMERIRMDDMQRWEEDIQLRDKVEQLCKDNVRLRHDMDQLQDKNAWLMDENMQLRDDIDLLKHDVESLQDGNARLHDENVTLRDDVKVEQEKTTSLAKDVDEMVEIVQDVQGQLRYQDKAMGFFTQVSARLENVMQETKDSMNDKVSAIQANIIALYGKNKKLQTSVELTNYRVQEVDEVSRQSITEVEDLRRICDDMEETMTEMHSNTEQRNIRLTYVYNVFYQYITEKISQSGVTKRLRRKGYLIDKDDSPITPASSVPPSPGIARTRE